MPQNPETRVQNAGLLELGARPDVLAWRVQVGAFRSMDDPGRIVRIGRPGMADVGAVVAVTITPDMVGQTIGVAASIEFKTARGRQTEAQAAWERAFRSRGGVYALVRDPAEIPALVASIQAGQPWR